MRYINGKQKGFDKRLVIIGLLILVAIVITALELGGITHIFRKETPTVVSGSSFNTKGVPKNTKSSAKSSGSVSDNKTSSDKSAASSTLLITPSGSFISNHHPNLSDSPAPNTISSVCNTTPGSSCKITFTKDGSTRSLPTQTVDANGSAYWNWKLQDIGLTQGVWNVQAIASLNGQTKTASDAMDMTVSP